jgi:hypothetical protein
MKANKPTGLISVSALEALESGKITRKNLTHEHFHSRTRVSLDLITDFNTNHLIQPPSVIVGKMVETAKRGLQTHFVLPAENNMLSPIQTKYFDLTWEEHYAMCGIILTPDPGVPQYKYRYFCPIREEEIIFSTQSEMADIFKVSKSTIGKWVKKGMIIKEEICQSPNESLINSKLTGYAFTPATTSQNT